MGQKSVSHLKGINGVIVVNNGDGATTFSSVDDRVSFCDTIQAINGTDLVISAMTEESYLNGDGTTTQRVTTVPAGQYIHGRFTAITVTSGTARCYIP